MEKRLVLSLLHQDVKTDVGLSNPFEDIFFNFKGSMRRAHIKDYLLLDQQRDVVVFWAPC